MQDSVVNINVLIHENLYNAHNIKYTLIMYKVWLFNNETYAVIQL